MPPHETPRQQTDAPGEFIYLAFISYSHRDEEWAQWLHEELETYRVPRRLVGRQTPLGPVPSRLFPVFRDREELASSADLGGDISDALARSRTLVVVCSPRSAASRWVNEEIKTFKALGREDCVLALLVLAYAALADFGVRLPGGESVRAFIDRHDISVMRPVRTEEEIRRSAVRQRRRLAEAIIGGRTDGDLPLVVYLGRQ